MGKATRFLSLISSLKVAIALLLLIAIASAIGTFIPQNETTNFYIEFYRDKPWLGFLNGEVILNLRLNHVYTSSWFFLLLCWLGIALIICSFRRQLPALSSSMIWIDYESPNQLSKLALAESKKFTNPNLSLDKLAMYLRKKGWQVKEHKFRLAARKGLIGRVGPLLVHIGLIILMIGAVWGAFSGNKVEEFLAPGRSLDLLNSNKEKQLEVKLKDFTVKRDPVGRPEQFTSKLELIQPGEVNGLNKMISVNHPLRYKGITIYQADWSLAAIKIQIGNSPKIQLPLKNIPELGEQVWGVVIPTSLDNEKPFLFSVSNEEGPISIFNEDGLLLASLRPGEEGVEINHNLIKVIEVLPASGLLLKKDPGVPFVYTGFAITLLGSGLSILSTRKLWAISDSNLSKIHIGGICNRNLYGLAEELPEIFNAIN